MKKTKNILLAIITITVLILCFAISVCAKTYSGNCGADGNNIKWSLNTETGELTINGSGKMADYSSLYSNRAPWNSRSEYIETITITEGITSIGNFAFYECANITELEIPDSVISIGNDAFCDCTSLKDITIPNSVKTIGFCAFLKCSSLESIEIPNSVDSLGDSCTFEGCESLSEIVLPDTITSIGSSYFAGCTVLKSITIPVSVININNSAFESCSSLADVYYSGTKEQWNQIEINSFNNEYLLNATIHYNFKIPYGFNFLEDSYLFKNYATAVSEKYFTTLFEPGAGKLLYKNFSAGALCYGMAYTASSIYNKFPSASLIYRDWISDKVFCHDDLRGVLESDGFSIDNLDIRVGDYIRYAHVYQFSSEAVEQDDMNWNDVRGLKELVQSYADNDMIGVMIGLQHCTVNSEGEFEPLDGHMVLAVGMDDNAILVYDSNNTESLERLYINEDDSWYYTGAWTTDGVTSDNSLITYEVNSNELYEVLSTGTEVTESEALMEGIKEKYIKVLQLIDTDKVVLDVKSLNYKIGADNYTLIHNYTADSETTSQGDVYWISDDKSVTVSEFSDINNTVKLGGDNTVISARVSKNSSVTMTIDETDINAELQTKIGDSFELSFNSVSNDMNITINGIASYEIITATQTDTGLLVTGISDGTVTLTKDEEVIATETIENAIGDIEITYDKDGESEELDADYHSHSYVSAETKASTCKETGVLTYTCSCNDSYTEEIAINPNNHIGETEIRDAKDSTCVEKGYAGDTYCLDCGEKIETGKETEKNGHKDVDGNNSCDTCGETLKECSHICHKTGFMGFIWKIIRFFFKLFKTNPVCDCGVAHY